MKLEQREELKTAAQRAEPSGCHIYTNPRDSNGWEENSKFQELATPAAILSLIAQVEALTVPQWQPIETAPTDCILLLATEFFHEGDWRIKVGGYWNGGWDVFGASWTPTHWMPLPAAPTIPAIPGTKEGA